MKEFFEFVVLGLGISAIYSLLSCGIVLIYRGSGVVNFAHGAFTLIGAITFSEIRTSGAPTWLALLAAVVAGALLGAIVQNPIMFTLRNAAPVTRLIAILGVMIIIESAATLKYGAQVTFVPPILPTTVWTVAGISIQSGQLILFGIATVIVIGLSVFQRTVPSALATRALPENETAVSALGWSPNNLATMNWAIGGALAGLAGALIVPISGLVVTNMVLLVVPALAAALVGRFNSFTWAFVGATGIGICQSLITRYVQQPGASNGFPFLIIIAVLIISGRGLPVRNFVNQRLTALGSGRIRWFLVFVVSAVAIILVLFVFTSSVDYAVTASLATAVVLLSIVVLTGYAGQLSLAQFSLAGLGAYVAGRLVAAAGVPFWLAVIIAVIAAVPIGALFALPALRTRGATLAVITLGLGVAIQSLLFDNNNYTGGYAGTNVGTTRLFGINIDPLDYPKRFGTFVLVVFILLALVVANIRRSATGRRMVAIRGNERAAASLGLSVMRTKLLAFMIATAIAAMGGICLAFTNSYILYNASFTYFQSIEAVGYGVIGGVGYVLGALFGSLLASGGVATLLNGVLSSISNYLGLIGGAAIILTLVLNPDGIAAETEKSLKRIKGFTRLLSFTDVKFRRTSVEQQSLDVKAVEKVRPQSLIINEASVQFGAVVAVDSATLTVEPGEIVALIGPNGAGKTSLIDAITGFARLSHGSVSLGEINLSHASAARRVWLGVARSWQSLELFEDISVLENLQISAESVSWSWFDDLRSLVWPRKVRMTSEARAAIEEFNLGDCLAQRPNELSYAQRRLVGIARAVALAPSVVLLDEPAAGLGPNETVELGRLVKRLASVWGMGVLLVEHDVDLVMDISDRIVVMDGGRVIATGSPSEIRSNSRVLAAYLGVPDVDEGAGVP
jgi:ABC-type branched-subunit amino acid transport system ATPase component/ABC-type branched-subunit amino acid transport system permease subunit